jgi:hypothetical protein
MMFCAGSQASEKEKQDFKVGAFGGYDDVQLYKFTML